MSLRLDNTKPESLILARLRAMTPEAVRRLHARTDADARRRGLIYGRRTLPFSLMPLVIYERHRRELARVCIALIRAMLRIPELYLADSEVRGALPLTPEEDDWLRSVWTGRRPREACIARFDADWGTAAPDGVRRLVLFETNTVSVGGFFYEPALADVIRRTVLPSLLRPAELRRFHHDVDMRLMLQRALTRQMRAIGARGRSVGILDENPGTGDWDEVPQVVRAFRRRGFSASYVDPRELSARGGAIFARGRRIEVFYRYVQLRDALALPGRQGRFEGLRQAFREDRVVPGLSGEFDHKSLWEVLQSERFTQYFPSHDRALFRRVIPWTRLIRERRTDGPYGKPVDLLPFVRRHQESLLLKPNRSFGGDGITFGARCTSSQWSAVLDRALRSKHGWVAQTWIVAHRKMVPAFRGGHLDPQPMYFTQGIFCDGHEIATFARLCPRPIVNVARGGLTAPGFVWR